MLRLNFTTIRIRCKRTLAAFLAIILVSAATNAFPSETDDYADLAGKKALAVAAGEPPVAGIAHSQANDLTASLLALTECKQKRKESNAPCELIRLNEIHVTTAHELFDELPPAPRPLFLWRYSSATATVFLVGSVHMLKETLYPLPEPYESAFSQSDTLVMEVDVNALTLGEQMAKMMEYGRLPEGETLRTTLSPELYERLSDRLSSDGMDIAMFESMNPSMIWSQLELLPMMSFGYNPEHGLEEYFTARKGERRVLELESIDQQLELLFGQPMAVQLQLLVELLDREEQTESLLAQLIGAWLAGDDEALLELFEQQQAGDSEIAEEFLRQLLDERNVGMTERIMEYLDGVGTYFVLIGAAHFIGGQGIINLLAQHGIEGVRIMSDAQL